MRNRETSIGGHSRNEETTLGKCEVSLERLLDYIEARLASPQWERLRVHIASGCSDCKQQTEWVEKLITMLREDSNRLKRTTKDEKVV